MLNCSIWVTCTKYMSPISMVVKTALFRLCSDQNEGVTSPCAIDVAKGRAFDLLAVKYLVHLT